MSELAHYTFIPWLRKGFGAELDVQDSLGEPLPAGAAKLRTEVSVDVLLRYQPRDEENEHDAIVSKTLQVRGPGDILAVSPDAILRVNPPANVQAFEPNLLVYIEFHAEDFLWRYTPASAPAGQPTRLRPWLWLLVLRRGLDAEFELVKRDGRPDILVIKESAINDVFSNHRETWAWAHVQLGDALSAQSGSQFLSDLGDELRADPDGSLSRLVSPRKLQPDTGYTAFLIPAFETGRLTGLGEDASQIPAQEPSWRRGQMPISTVRPREIPIYHQWEFATGADGDFETLVSHLKPFPIRKDSRLPMDIQSAGLGLDAADLESKTLDMQGALKPVGYVPLSWPAGPKDAELLGKLRTIVNMPGKLRESDATRADPHPVFANCSVGDDPMVMPPLYGRWHALVATLDQPNAPNWINTINTDLRFRAAAGLGARIVQRHQERYMDEAWNQVEEVNEANKKIREAALASMVADAAFVKHVASESDDLLLLMTTRVQELVPAQGAVRQSVKSQLRTTRVPESAISPTLNRLLRPGRKINRSVEGAGHSLRNEFVQRFGRTVDRLTAAAEKVPSSASTAIADVAASIDTAVSAFTSNPKALAKEAFVLSLEAKDLSEFDKAAIKAHLTTQGLSIPTAILADRLVNAVSQYERTDAGLLTVFLQVGEYEYFFDAHSNLKSGRSSRVRLRKAGAEDDDVVASGFTMLREITQFRDSFAGFQSTVTSLAPPTLRAAVSSSDISAVRQRIVQALRPSSSVLRRISNQVRMVIEGNSVPLSDLVPIMAHPTFVEPVYAELAAESQAYVLPNVHELPLDSIAVVQTNQAFVEALFVGMNHEFGRELLWREYPTDQRGAYFRTLWDAADDPNLGSAGRQSITPIHLWQGALGTHQNDGTAYERVVLVVRGRVFQKYPHTLVYAQKATGVRPSGLADSNDPANVKYPLFKARLEPDIYLFGFDLDAMTARGNPDDPTNAGWFFMFKERPGELKLGLDDYADPGGDSNAMPAGPPSTWDALAWEHLVGARTELTSYHIAFNRQITPLSAPTGSPVFGANSADMASILYQNPVIFGRHARELIDV